jgi:hypothetical protein
LGITSDEALSLEEFPKRAVILGAGCVFFFISRVSQLLLNVLLINLYIYVCVQLYCSWVCIYMAWDGFRCQSCFQKGTSFEVWLRHELKLMKFNLFHFQLITYKRYTYSTVYRNHIFFWIDYVGTKM